MRNDWSTTALSNPRPSYTPYRTAQGNEEDGDTDWEANDIPNGAQNTRFTDLGLVT